MRSNIARDVTTYNMQDYKIQGVIAQKMLLFIYLEKWKPQHILEYN
jgi:hypothetical protein